MAKLAVVTSVPKTRITHWPLSVCSAARANKFAAETPVVGPLSEAVLATQDVTRSDQRTPRSRANCSSVTGRKEPDRVGQSGKIDCAWSSRVRWVRTDTAHSEHLGRETIGIPSLQLLVSREASVFVVISRSTLCPTWPRRRHLMQICGNRVDRVSAASGLLWTGPRR